VRRVSVRGAAGGMVAHARLSLRRLVDATLDSRARRVMIGLIDVLGRSD
jgi:hypothetical protein